MNHDWKWHDQFARYPFNDKSKRPHPVDVWKCGRCQEMKNTITGDPPRESGCKGR